MKKIFVIILVLILAGNVCVKAYDTENVEDTDSVK